MTVNQRFTLDDLVARVTDEVHKLDMQQANGQVSATPDGRTLRYYSSLGLLDRPVEVRGRRALYGPRHVLQAVAVKALQAQGLALQEIQQRLAGRSDDELQSLIGRPTATRFWQEPPTTEPVADVSLDADVDVVGHPPPSPAPAGTLAPSDVDPVALRLGRGVTLVLDPARPVAENDIHAVRTAGAALLSELRRRGLTPSEQEPT